MIKTQYKYTLNFNNNGLIFIYSHTAPIKNVIIQICNNIKNDATLYFNLVDVQYRNIIEADSALEKDDMSTQESPLEKLFFREIWEGIDLEFSIVNGQLKYEFIVHPGAEIKNIKFKYNFADKVELDNKGNLIINVNNITIIDQAPICYQIIEGIRVPLKSNYVLNYSLEGSPIVTINFAPNYDPNYLLIVDPYITFFN